MNIEFRSSGAAIVSEMQLVCSTVMGSNTVNSRTHQTPAEVERPPIIRLTTCHGYGRWLQIGHSCIEKLTPPGRRAPYTTNSIRFN